MIIIRTVILGLLGIHVVHAAYGREWLDSVAKYLGYAEENNIELTDESFLNFVKNKSVSSVSETKPALIVTIESTVTVTQTALPKSETKTSTLSSSIGSKSTSFPSKMEINGDVLLQNKHIVDEMKLNNTNPAVLRLGTTRKLLQVDASMLVSRVSDIPNLYTNAYHDTYAPETPPVMPKINGSTGSMGYNAGQTHNSTVVPTRPQYQPDVKPGRVEKPDERVYTIDYMNVGSAARAKYGISILITVINLVF